MTSSTGRSPSRRRRAATVRGKGAYALKRSLDVAGASLLLVVALPILALCALAVRLSSSGPVLFRHLRYGRGGRRFECFKFRTMVQDAEEWLEEDGALQEAHRENGYKLPTEKDPRVTTVGRILRKTHLDELPQLLNVLRGDMSLVGPRPIIEEEVEMYGPRADTLLSVRPGIFGPWTAMGKDRPAYPERMEVELRYARDASLTRDLRILLRNFFVVLRGQ